MSGPDIRHPIPHRLVDRLLQGGLASSNRDDFRPKKLHPGDIQGLPLHIDLAHVDHAFAAESGGDRCGGDAVLAGPGFGDDPSFAHALGEKDLTERVINLVRSGVKEVFTLEINLWVSKPTAEAFGKIKRSGAAGESAEQTREFISETGIVLCAVVFFRETLERGHQSSGHKHAAIWLQMAVKNWNRLLDGHRQDENVQP